MYQALRTSLLSTARCWDADSERYYQVLFDKLDTNKDGKVDVAELRAGLKAMGMFRHGAAQVTRSKGIRCAVTDLSFKSWEDLSQGFILVWPIVRVRFTPA